LDDLPSTVVLGQTLAQSLNPFGMKNCRDLAGSDPASILDAVAKCTLQQEDQ